MSKLEIIAFHGWAFDATCWQSWEKLMPEYVSWMNFDRGYFGTFRSPDFSSVSVQKIIITHSFGFHLCEDELIRQADLLIILSGFQQFHPLADVARRRSKRIMNRMINQFEKRPGDVLQAFYRNVFHPAKRFERPPKELDKDRLLTDLKQLNKANCTLPKLKKSTKVCIFHGVEDGIVSPQKGRALSRRFGARASYCDLPGAGHALPMRHAKKIWTRIKGNIPAVK